MSQINSALERIERGAVRPLYLVAGDRIVSEPAAARVGQALADRVGCDVDILRRPESLTPALQDLRTFAMFASGKVTVVIESSTLADAATAPSLVDEAIEALPIADAEAALGARERRAAACFLQALRLFQLDPYSGTPAEIVEELPAVALEGGPAVRKKTRRKRSAKQIENARNDLVTLLEAARRADVQGLGESEEEVLAEILRDGLPEGHFLVLGESTWAKSHPVVVALQAADGVIEVGQVSASRKAGWQGLDLVCQELERETGVGIDRAALQELARRTLRMRQGSRGGDGAVDAESTARFAAEYRKLVTLGGGKTISRALVAEAIQDRGEEDIWGVLDAVGEGRAGKAIAGIDRLLRGADDVIGMRLSVLSLLAGFCRQLVAVGGMVEASRSVRAERSYPRFKQRVAPALQAELAGGRKNPLAGLHPYRLHRVYLAASRLGASEQRRLQSRVLETEKRLKGNSVAPDAALAVLVADLATSIGSSASGSHRR
jgi:DNA polymerase III delta subunit